MTKLSKTESWPEKHTLVFADCDKETLKHLLSSKLSNTVYAIRPKKKGETLRYAVFKKSRYMKMIKDFLPAAKRSHFPDIEEDIVSLKNLRLPKKKVIIKNTNTDPSQQMQLFEETYNDQNLELSKQKKKKKMIKTETNTDPSQQMQLFEETHNQTEDTMTEETNTDPSQQTHNNPSQQTHNDPSQQTHNDDTEVLLLTKTEDTMMGEASTEPFQQTQLYPRYDDTMTRGGDRHPFQRKPYSSGIYQSQYPRYNTMTRGRGSYRRPFQRKPFLNRTYHNEFQENGYAMKRGSYRPHSQRTPFLNRTYENQMGNSPFKNFDEHSANADPFLWMKCLRIPYKQQVEEKLGHVRNEINLISESIKDSFPIYSTSLNKKFEENEGLICSMDPLRECQFDKNMVLSLAIGKDESNKFVVGLDRKCDILEPLSMVVHNYADHIVKLAEVFQIFLEKTSTYVTGKTFWNKLIVHTNLSKEIMLTVMAYYTTSLDSEEMNKKLISALRKFFEEEEGKECCVTSLYFKLCTRDGIPQDSELIIGSPTIEDEVVGLKLHLPPRKLLWTSMYGPEMLCKAIEELLIPTKELSILEVGCNSGFIGLYLSKLVGEVLSIDSHTAVEIAKENKELNNITNCTYFSGEYWRCIIRAAENIKLDTAYAILLNPGKLRSNNSQSLTELRMIKELQKILLVVDTCMDSPADLVLSLSDPDTSQDKGNPFFPVRALPLDTMPNVKGHILLLLLERFNIDTQMSD